MNKNVFIKLFVVIVLLFHGFMLVEYDVISFDKDEVTTINPQLTQLTMHTKTLVVYDDEIDALSTINQTIQDNITCDIYSLQDNNNIDVSDYTHVLIGSSIINDEPTCKVQEFLTQHDLTQKKISFYWVGAYDYQHVQETMTSHVKDSKIYPELGLNSDEISETTLVQSITQEWLSSMNI